MRKKGVKQIYMAFSFVGKSPKNMLVEKKKFEGIFFGTYIVHINCLFNRRFLNWKCGFKK